MNLVAGQAGSSFFPVDMEIVKVSVSITEIGQAGGPLIQYHGLLVALETKGVNFRVKRIIELLYKIIFQSI
jgi:hypothetical protein